MYKVVAVNEQGLRIGESHPNVRYTDGEVEMVLTLHAEGWGYKRIAKAVEMPKTTVRDICKGRRRGQYAVKFKRIKVGEEGRVVVQKKERSPGIMPTPEERKSASAAAKYDPVKDMVMQRASWAKLSASQVAAIIRRFHLGETVAALAAEYRVSTRHVQWLVRLERHGNTAPARKWTRRQER